MSDEIKYYSITRKTFRFLFGGTCKNSKLSGGSIINRKFVPLFDGSYNSLTDKPELFDGNYNNLSNKPQLFSGSYNDLTNKPNVVERFEINNGESVPVGTKNGDIVTVNFSNKTLLGTVTESDIKEFNSCSPGSNTVFYPTFDTY